MYDHILLPIDPSDAASYDKALPVAAKLAEAYGARLHIMTVAPDFGLSIVGQFFPEGFEKEALAAAREAIAAVVEKAALPATIPVQLIVAHGAVYEEILRAAGAVNADLIVIGAHRPALKDFLLGPNAARVVRHATMSVMVVR